MVNAPVLPVAGPPWLVFSLGFTFTGFKCAQAENVCGQEDLSTYGSSWQSQILLMAPLSFPVKRQIVTLARISNVVGVCSGQNSSLKPWGLKAIVEDSRSCSKSLGDNQVHSGTYLHRRNRKKGSLQALH